MSAGIEGLNRTNDALDSISDALDPIIEKSAFSENREQLTAIEDAKLNVSLAFAVGSLYYMLLNASGGGPSGATNHPIHRELNEVKTRIQKIKELENGEVESSSKFSSTPSPSPTKASHKSTSSGSKSLHAHSSSTKTVKKVKKLKKKTSTLKKM